MSGSYPSHLEVTDNENGIAVTALDELALWIRDLTVVHEDREGVERHVVGVRAPLASVVHKSRVPVLVVLFRENIVSAV